MNTQLDLQRLIKANVDRRVKDVIEQTKEEAAKILSSKLDQLAVDLAIEINQSQLVAEMAQEIRLVIVK